MRVEEVEPNIFMVFMNDRYSLGRTFMRFQEYYESPYPDIRNNVFTREHFRKIYRERRNACNFTYCNDWAGYNIPSYILKPFIDGKFNPLVACEKKLVNLFKNVKGKFYVIGAIPSDKATVKHEISHGLWYTRDEYKVAQRKALKGLSKHSRKKIDYYLSDYGYCKEVLEDETVAFLLANSKWIKKGCRILATELNPVVAKIKANYKKFSGKSSQK